MTLMTIINKPLMIELKVIAHQTPSKPNKAGAESKYAAGTLNPVKIMLMTAGGFVLPTPLNNPAKVISIHMNI